MKLIFGTIATLAALGAHSVAAGTTTSLQIAAQNVEWQETPIGADVATVEGDTFGGAHVTLVRFKAGMKTPVHTHSSDYSGVVVAGKSRHFEPGKPETETVLEQGAYWFIGGNVPHISECLDGETCIFAISQDHAFDFHAVE